MRLIEMILSALENRLLRAYRAKNALDLQDFIDMPDDQRKRLFRDIAANYPVPRTEQGYFYHGTSRDRLSSIRSKGLTVGNEGRWQHTSVGVDHSKGRIFFTANFDRAEWYAGRWSKNPIYLRISDNDLGSREDDPEEPQGVFVTHSLPPTALQIWSKGNWRTL